MPIDRLTARSFGVQYVQGPGAPDAAALAAAPHEALILEALNYAPGYAAASGAAAVAAMQAGGKEVFLYMTVGESSDLRRYWDPAWTSPAAPKPPNALPSGGGADVDGRTGAAPDWISDWVSGASGGAARLVQFWQPEWLAILKDEIDFLLGDLGADGLFLDNVASYFEWITFDALNAPNRPGDDLDQPATFYAAAMADLVVAISDYVQATYPGARIIANGNPFLPFDTGDRAGKGQAFLDAISAMMQEGVYHSGGNRYDNAATQNALRTVVAAEGVPILALDYIDPADRAKLDAFARDAARDGFLAYSDELDLALDGLQPALNQPTEGADTLFLGPATGTLAALGGDDDVLGSDLDDAAALGDGNDTLRGEGGEDTAVVAGTRAAAFVSATTRGDGGVDLALAGARGTDVLHSVEFVAFDDQTVALADLLAPPPPLLPDGRPSLVSVTNANGLLLIDWRLDNDGPGDLAAGAVLAFTLTPAGGGAPALSGRIAAGAAAAGAAATGTASLDTRGLGLAGAFDLAVEFDPDDALAAADPADDRSAATPVTLAGPNGVLASLVLVTTAVSEGAALTFDWSVTSDGDDTLPSMPLAIFLRPAGGGASVALGRIAVPALAPGATRSGTDAFVVPPAVTPGDWILHAVLDPDGAVTEADETDNLRDAPGLLPVAPPAGPPDAAPSALSLADPDATLAPGAILSLAWTLANAGESALPASDLAVDLRPAGGGDAIRLQLRTIDALAPGASVPLSEDLTLPQDLAPGDWIVEVTHDPAGAVAEADEANNTLTAALTVAAPGPVFTAEADTVTLPGAGGPWDALGGDDRVTGSAAADTIRLGAGNDLAALGDGGDVAEGGPGRDTLRGEGGPDDLVGGGGNDSLSGGAGRDDLLGERGHDALAGGASADFLDGGAGRDTLDGGGGADELAGRGGADRLLGGRGRDLLEGGAGRDTLDGGDGADTLVGGGGRDVFVIRRGDDDDVIRDFGGRDVVDLTDFGFRSARQVLRRLERDGAVTELSLPGGGEIDFEGLRPADFDRGDFLV